jgi:hypothetical protein
MTRIIQTVLVHRVPLSLLLSACAAMIGPHALPMDADNPLLGLIALKRPTLYAGLSYGYVTLWATTALVAFSVVTSVLHPVRAPRSAPAQPGVAAVSCCQPPAHPLPRPRRTTPSTHRDARQYPRLAAHPRARTLHRHRRHRRHRIRQDLGLHLSLRPAAPRVQGTRPRPQAGRTHSGGERGLLRAGPADPRGSRPRR